MGNAAARRRPRRIAPALPLAPALALILVAVAALLQAAAASFLSGLTAIDYPRGAPLEILAHSLFAHHKLPYDYKSLPFCPPSKDAAERAQATHADAVSLGEILLGERARLTGFSVRMLQDVECGQICTATFAPKAVAALAKRIRLGYRARLTLDGMPGVMRETNGSYFELGAPLGYVGAERPFAAKVSQQRRRRDNADALGMPNVVRAALGGVMRLRGLLTPQVYVYNHLDFTIMYHVPNSLESVTGTGALPDGNSFRVVGFEIVPRSVKYPLSNPANGSDPAAHCLTARHTPPGPQEPLQLLYRGHAGADDAQDAARQKRVVFPQDLKFTYSVRFVESTVSWVTRFDTLMKVSHGRAKIQWFAIVNSLMLATFLTAVFAAVLLRTLRRDCARYGFSSGPGEAILDEFNDDFENDSGWRMLRGDVFRAPRAGSLLCVLCGSGCQLTVVVFVTLLAAAVGLISPNRRGQLVASLVVMYALSSSVAGYVAASMHRAIGGSRWRVVTFGVALVLPGIAFSTFLTINVFLWFMGSIGAAPFSTLFMLLLLWLGVSVPLAFAGTYFGYIRKVYDFPVRTNQIPRQIPPQARFSSSPTFLLAAGAIPFGMVGIELRLVLKSIMEREIYHMFAFLLAVSILLVVTCAEVSVVMSYMRLANEDWAWWWPSFLASGSSGLYVFAFSIYMLSTSSSVAPGHTVANFLFVAYAGLFSLSFSLLTGSIGCLSSLAFVRRIFRSSSDD
jgi:transmembrane 9 superfamily member 2/4